MSSKSIKRALTKNIIERAMKSKTHCVIAHKSSLPHFTNYEQNICLPNYASKSLPALEQKLTVNKNLHLLTYENASKFDTDVRAAYAKNARSFMTKIHNLNITSDAKETILLRPHNVQGAFGQLFVSLLKLPILKEEWIKSAASKQ